MISSSGRMLVIRRGGPGDFILALPVLEALQRRYSGLHLEVMGPPALLPLALRSGYIQGTKSVEIPGLSTFYGEGVTLDPRLSDYFRSFNYIMILGVDPEGQFSANLKRAGIHEVTVIPPFPPEGHIIHVSDYLVRMAAGFPDAKHPRVLLYDEELRAVRSSLLAQMGHLSSRAADPFPPLAAIHPGSGGFMKVWPPRFMARAAKELIREGHIAGVILSEGPADALFVEALKNELTSVPVITVSYRPLLELAAILRSARLFLGSDSGVAHLAAAVGIPTCVIFGPTDPRRWAPRGPSVAVIQEKTTCAPCGAASMQTCTERECLGEALIEDVLRAARSLLSAPNHI